MVKKSAGAHLLAAIQDKRPIVLVLGQDAWADAELQDRILVKSLAKLGLSDEIHRGWPALLGMKPLPEGFYEWMAERFARRVHPVWLEVLGALPWSAVFTSSLDPTLKNILVPKGREPNVVLTANDILPFARSRARPPLYHLFGQACSDPETKPPSDRMALNAHLFNHTLPLLGRLLETTTALGLVVVEGFVSNRGWLKVRDILDATGGAESQRILWFGGMPQLEVQDEDAALFQEAVQSGRILVESSRLSTVVAELKAADALPELDWLESEEAGTISFKEGKRLQTPPATRRLVETVASIVDDSWTAFLAPLGEDAKYTIFRRFHGDLEGARLLVEGIRRGFAIERDFERKLRHRVDKLLSPHAHSDTPILVHGQSGTGKSVALARLAIHFRMERKEIAVLYATERIPPPQNISGFCEVAEKAGAMATLIVCDANQDVSRYRDLLKSLRSRGRRVVVVGSRYRFPKDKVPQTSVNIEAPVQLTAQERRKLADLLTRFLPSRPDPTNWIDTHILTYLYRFLPASRPRLGAEARATEKEIRIRGSQYRPSQPLSQLAE